MQYHKIILLTIICNISSYYDMPKTWIWVWLVSIWCHIVSYQGVQYYIICCHLLVVILHHMYVTLFFDLPTCWVDVSCDVSYLVILHHHKPHFPLLSVSHISQYCVICGFQSWQVPSFFSPDVAILRNITSQFWPPQMQTKCCDNSGIEANTCSRGLVAS